MQIYYYTMQLYLQDSSNLQTMHKCTWLGGLGLTKPTEMADLEYTSSQKITAPLVALILIQQHEITYDTIIDQERAKTEVRQSRQQHQSTHATQLHSRLPRHLQRAVELCSEKVLPIEDNGFAIHKGAFRDALCLRYNWSPPQLPQKCVCSHSFSVDHAFNCSTGGLPTV